MLSAYWGLGFRGPASTQTPGRLKGSSDPSADSRQNRSRKVFSWRGSGDKVDTLAAFGVECLGFLRLKGLGFRVWGRVGGLRFAGLVLVLS